MQNKKTIPFKMKQEQLEMARLLHDMKVISENSRTGYIVQLYWQRFAQSDLTQGEKKEKKPPREAD